MSDKLTVEELAVLQKSKGALRLATLEHENTVLTLAVLYKLNKGDEIKDDGSIVRTSDMVRKVDVEPTPTP
jgi:hypothetical protein